MAPPERAGETVKGRFVETSTPGWSLYQEGNIFEDGHSIMMPTEWAEALLRARKEVVP